MSRLSGGYKTFLTISGQATKHNLEAKRYQATLLKSDGLGVQPLGIGVNGHVGFNEPGCHLESHCRHTALADSTLEGNGYQPGTRAITLGIADIMSAQKINIVVTSTAKSPAVKAMIEGPQSGACPASLLRGHSNLTLFLDQAVAMDLS